MEKKPYIHIANLKATGPAGPICSFPFGVATLTVDVNGAIVFFITKAELESFEAQVYMENVDVHPESTVDSVDKEELLKGLNKFFFGLKTYDQGKFKEVSIELEEV